MSVLLKVGKGKEYGNGKIKDKSKDKIKDQEERGQEI